MFKKVLLVSKTQRMERLIKKGYVFTPYIESNYKKDWYSMSLSSLQVESYCCAFRGKFETCYNEICANEVECTVKKEMDLDENDLGDHDLVISVGGDSTYLQSAGIMDSSKVPLLGINSDPTRRRGHLTNIGVDKKFMKTQIKMLLKNVLDGTNLEYFYRTRALFTLENMFQGGSITERLVLNEVFAAEKDVSTTSMYRLEVDGKDIGKFKSSGIIISTGTGSSGWLFSARQVTYNDVLIVQGIIGADRQSELASQQLVNMINSHNVMPSDSDQLYYFVREGYVSDPASFTWRAEGLCKEIKVTSEIIDGSVQVDGFYNMDVGIGDKFTMKVGDQSQSLKCIKLSHLLST